MCNVYVHVIVLKWLCWTDAFCANVVYLALYTLSNWLCSFSFSVMRSLNASLPKCSCDASLLALLPRHMRYWAGGSSGSHSFSCHKWNIPWSGARMTSRLLWINLRYSWTSSNPHPWMVVSNPRMKRKSERYMHVIPKPNVLQKPDSRVRTSWSFQLGMDEWSLYTTDGLYRLNTMG